VADSNKYAELLANWSVEEEQSRADFLDFLYALYERTDGCYTGLWQRFCEDMTLFLRGSVKTDLALLQVVALNLKSSGCLVESNQVVS